MKLSFTKMHGAGNDFVVLNAFKAPINLSEEQIRFIGNRHFGIGADQILIVEPPEWEGCEFKYRIYNQDGNEVEMCGNGARCFAKYVFDRKLTSNRKFKVQTAKGIIIPELLDNGEVKINMGEPNFAPASLPFIENGLEKRTMGGLDQWKIAVEGRDFWFSICSMGNPHAVIFVDDISEEEVCFFGPIIEKLPCFPQRTNVEFLKVLDRRKAVFRVWERGAGPTLACGSGNCAAFACGVKAGLLDNEAEFENPGGSLRLSWEGKDKPLFLIGPAVEVFEGEMVI